MLSTDPESYYGVSLGGGLEGAFLAEGDVEKHVGPLVCFRWRSVLEAGRVRRADADLEAALRADGDGADGAVLEIIRPRLAATLVGWRNVPGVPNRRGLTAAAAPAAVEELLDRIDGEDLMTLWVRYVRCEALAAAAARRFCSSPSAPGTATGATPGRAANAPSASTAPPAAASRSGPTGAESPAAPAAAAAN